MSAEGWVLIIAAIIAGIVKILDWYKDYKRELRAELARKGLSDKIQFNTEVTEAVAKAQVDHLEVEKQKAIAHAEVTKKPKDQKIAQAAEKIADETTSTVQKLVTADPANTGRSDTGLQANNP